MDKFYFQQVLLRNLQTIFVPANVNSGDEPHNAANASQTPKDLDANGKQKSAKVDSSKGNAEVTVLYSSFRDASPSESDKKEGQ